MMAAVAVRPRLGAAVAGGVWEVVLIAFAVPWPPVTMSWPVAGVLAARLACAALLTAAFNVPAQRYRARAGS